jgi:urease accessory protein
MELIRNPIAASSSGKPRIVLRADRLTLAKRRWRATAEDGAEFGFDLVQAIGDGSSFFETNTGVYTISQLPEEVFAITPDNAAHAAHIGWMIGNLHFPIAIEQQTIVAPSDPAVRQLLERERIPFTVMQKIFHPLKAASPHGH